MDSMHSMFFAPQSNYASAEMSKKLLSPLKMDDYERNDSFILFSAMVSKKQLQPLPESTDEEKQVILFTANATLKTATSVYSRASSQFIHMKTTEQYEDSGSDLCPKKRGASNPWTAAEDECLRMLIEEQDNKQWNIIAEKINNMFPMRPPRNSNQCNQRWSRVLAPGIQKGKWGKEEDEVLLKALLSVPPQKWKLVADQMPNRTDIQVRYRVKKIGNWLQKNGVPRSYL